MESCAQFICPELVGRKRTGKKCNIRKLLVEHADQSKENEAFIALFLVIYVHACKKHKET